MSFCNMSRCPQKIERERYDSGRTSHDLNQRLGRKIKSTSKNTFLHLSSLQKKRASLFVKRITIMSRHGGRSSMKQFVGFSRETAGLRLGAQAYRGQAVAWLERSTGEGRGKWIR